MRFNYKSQLIEFKPRFIPLVSFFLALGILISMSSWQFKRLKWKESLINLRVSNFEKIPEQLDSFKEPSKNEFRKANIKGTLLNDQEMFMPALSKNGNNGFHILVPFKTSDNKFYVFDTGWIPLKLKEKSLRKNNLIIESKQFEAVIRIPGRKGYFQPDNDIIKNTWFFVEPGLMSEYLQIPFVNEIYLEAINNGPGGYPIGNQTRIYLRNNHLQYALTWMFLSFGLIGVFLFSNFKIIKK